MPPKVSVLIKTYNHRAYIAQCIRSLLDQSFQDFEIVVTDDGSSDGTADVVRQFTDPRIRLQVSSTNEGISNAMNRTIARAQGELVAILNSDDFALPQRLALQVSFFEQHPGVAALFTKPLLVGENGERLAEGWPEPGDQLNDLEPDTLLRYFFFHGNFLCAPTAMIRRSVYARIGEYDPRLTNLQDLDMWIRMTLAGLRFHVLDQALTAYRKRDNSGNMSAQRRDSILRAEFEYSRILARYRSLPLDSVKRIFADDIARLDGTGDASANDLLALLALTRNGPAHRLFGLETLYETAQTIADERRLRYLMGQIDVFGLDARLRRKARRRALRGAIQRLFGPLAVRRLPFGARTSLW